MYIPIIMDLGLMEKKVIIIVQIKSLLSPVAHSRMVWGLITKKPL